MSAVPVTSIEPQRVAIRVLVVDDNRVDRMRCRRLLETHPELDVSVSEANSVDEAEQLCAVEWFDCIIADYHLPTRKGTELAHADAGIDDPPVILLTGSGGEHVALRALQAGMCDYIKKDALSENSLQRALSYALRRSSLLRAVHAKSRELALANTELQKRTCEIERFYHTVSHELKTPLTAAREFISLVNDEVFGNVNVRQREYLRHALDCCDQLAVHFNDMVDTCRLETGKLGIKPVRERIENAIMRASMALCAIANSRDISLQRVIPHGVPDVKIDLGRIVQVIANLLSNALKYTDKGGVVSISVACEGENFVKVWVQDTGCGIAAEHLPRIFERLYQVSPAGENLSGAGIGLGLYICREIIELHGGSIGVSSSVGAGSVFWFTVPVAT